MVTMIPLKKRLLISCETQWLPKTGRGLEFRWIFVGPFLPFSGLPDSTQVPLMLEQLRRSGLLQAVRESSRWFFGRQWSIWEAMKMGSFLTDFLTPSSKRSFQWRFQMV